MNLKFDRVCFSFTCGSDVSADLWSIDCTHLRKLFFNEVRATNMVEAVLNKGEKKLDWDLYA